MDLPKPNRIKDKTELLNVIERIHFESFKLCKKILHYYLPVAGNLGVFCHFEDEFKDLSKIREELTDLSDNWNSKYFKLHQPIKILGKDDVPETTYDYLYIRKPEVGNNRIGDIDFYLKPDRYNKLKNSYCLEKLLKELRFLIALILI